MQKVFMSLINTSAEGRNCLALSQLAKGAKIALQLDHEDIAIYSVYLYTYLHSYTAGALFKLVPLHMLTVRACPGVT